MDHELMTRLQATIKSDFELTVLPQKNDPITPYIAQFRLAVMSATLTRAQCLAEAQGQDGPNAPYRIIGTTRSIFDGLRHLYTESVEPLDLAHKLLSAQDHHRKNTGQPAPEKRHRFCGFGG